jgi:hypothetical protein
MTILILVVFGLALIYAVYDEVKDHLKKRPTHMEDGKNKKHGTDNQENKFNNPSVKS